MRSYSIDVAIDEQISDEPDNRTSEVAASVAPQQVVHLVSSTTSGESVIVEKAVQSFDEPNNAANVRLVAGDLARVTPGSNANGAEGLTGFWQAVSDAGGTIPEQASALRASDTAASDRRDAGGLATDAYMLMGDYLVATGIITKMQLEEALEQQSHSFERIGEVLVRLKLVVPADVEAALVWQQGRRTLEQLMKMFHLKTNHIRSVLHRVEKRQEPMQQVMRDTRYLSEDKVALALASLSNRYQYFASSRVDQCRFADLIADGIALDKYDGFVPVAKLDDGTLAIALDDIDRRNDAHNHFGSFPKKMYLLASGHTLQKIYCTYFSRTEEQLLSEIEKAEALIAKRDEANEAGGYMRKLIGLILRHASYSGASDIHFECSRVIGTLLMRYDGVRRDIAYFTPELHTRLTTMLKMDGLRGSNEGEGAASVMREGKITFDKDAEMQREFRDIFERYGYRLEIGEASNEKTTAVIRVIDSQGATSDIDNLGLDEYTRGIFDEAISAPDGLILLVGPTGSGKTTTLYAGLGEIDSEEISIQTIENPVEGEHGKWKQYQPNDAAGTAEGAQMGGVFKGTMRNDPDVILVGEIRDGDVADTAIQASKTGHLVFSTLHVNRAAGTPGRLIGLGVERQDIADTLRLIMAQRLVRQLCSACAEVDDRPETHAVIDGAMKRFLDAEGCVPKTQRARDGGCEQCRHTGYRGRKMVYEAMKFTKKIRKMIEDGASTSAIESAAIPNGRSMWDYGLRMLASGRTSAEEIKRVIPDWSEAE